MLTLFILILSNFAFSQFFDKPPSINSISIGKKLEVGSIFLCPEIRIEFRPHNLIIEDKIDDSIKAISAFILRYPHYVFEIGVHTDSRGSVEGNLLVSEKRAEYIYKSLTEDFKINSNYLTFKGYGQEKPLIKDSLILPYMRADNNKFEMLHQVNRRVELKVIDYKWNEIDSLKAHRYSKSFTDSIFSNGDLIPCPRVNFKFNNEEIETDYIDSIKRIADFIIKNPKIIFEIGVHSDARGRKTSSTILSEKRAKFMCDYLINNFNIPSNQLKNRGYEEVDPLVPEILITPYEKFEKEEYEYRHSLNRRVELKVLKVND